MSSISKMMKGLETKYKVFTVLSPITMIGEVVMETIIPMMMANIIDKGIADNNLKYVLTTGLIMIACACISLTFGALGARFSAVASFGFSRNLRRNLFSKVQDFSFGNVDHFSTSSLVTRLTTDVTNIQNTYQMLIRACFRAPIMMIAGIVMAVKINPRLSIIFLVALPVLTLVLIVLSTVAYPRFQKMLTQYDNLNSTVQENLIGIRVVKSFVRTKFEDKKFEEKAENVLKTQVSAEKLVIFIMPVMQIVVYLCIIASLWFGGRMITVGNMQTGELTSFITYITQILMSLMMLSMVFIMLVLSRASVTRIVEVLDEEPEIKSPEGISYTDEKGNTVKAVFDRVPDGSIDFKNVSFSYLKDAQNTVLDNINLHIDSGAVVGIIGGT